jgi:putative transposase
LLPPEQPKELNQLNEPNEPNEPTKSSAEKTIEDVLFHFGETQKAARRTYRDFVEKGIAQGRRHEFQGGGLVRSAGGNKTGLLGRSKEEREKGDARILGSGDFVLGILKEANDCMDSKAQRPPLRRRDPLRKDFA